MERKRFFGLTAAVALVVFGFSCFRTPQQDGRIYAVEGEDEGRSVQQTPDGGYIIAGTRNVNGGTFGDLYLIKTNASGDTVWTRLFGSAYEDRGYSVRRTVDGGYIIAGLVEGKCALTKVSDIGTQSWCQTYGVYSGGCAVEQTNDSGYIVVSLDGYLIKTSPSGDTQWTRWHGALGYTETVQQTDDGGYILAGWVEGYPAMTLVLAKTDAVGETLWTRTYGGTERGSRGMSVQQTSDGGYAVAGRYKSSNFDVGFYLVKTDPAGDTLWTRVFGYPTGADARSVHQTADGGYILAGITGEMPKDVLLIKTDSGGTETWRHTYGGGKTEDDANEVQQTEDGGYIVVGTTGTDAASTRDVYLIKTDSRGNPEF